MTYKTPQIIGMLDIESLSTSSNAVVTQVGLVLVMASDPETVLSEIEIHLPIEPQLTLKREVSASTLIWWMGQNDVARKNFALNAGDDFDELPALLRHLNRKFEQVVDGQDYELFARGPQFDIVNVESLMADVAIKPAWKYDRIRDLRTVMAEAGLSTKAGDVPRDTTRFPEHVAVADCHYQLLCLTEARRQLRSRS